MDLPKPKPLTMLLAMTATIHSMPANPLKALVPQIIAAFGKIDTARIDAGRLLLEAQRLFYEQGINQTWHDWCTDHIPKSWSDIKKVMALARAADPEAALKTEQEKSKIGMRVSRAKKAASGQGSNVRASGRKAKSSPSASEIYQRRQERQKTAAKTSKIIDPHRAQAIADGWLKPEDPMPVQWWILYVDANDKDVEEYGWSRTKLQAHTAVWSRLKEIVGPDHPISTEPFNPYDGQSFLDEHWGEDWWDMPIDELSVIEHGHNDAEYAKIWQEAKEALTKRVSTASATNPSEIIEAKIKLALARQPGLLGFTSLADLEALPHGTLAALLDTLVHPGTLPFQLPQIAAAFLAKSGNRLPTQIWDFTPEKRRVASVDDDDGPDPAMDINTVREETERVRRELNVIAFADKALVIGAEIDLYSEESKAEIRGAAEELLKKLDEDH